jgi:hypothetical protein
LVGLTLPAQFQRVLSQPGSTPGATAGLRKFPPFAQAAGGFARGREAAQLAMLLHRAAYPVNGGIASDRFMVGINQDHLEVLVGGVLAHPVGVQYTKALQTSVKYNI